MRELKPCKCKNLEKPLVFEGFWGPMGVDRAEVDRAVDLARTLLSGAQGLGPRARDPIGPWGPRGPTRKALSRAKKALRSLTSTARPPTAPKGFIEL